jgi:hypothetical protein
MKSTHRLTKAQKTELGDALQKLDMDAKCKIYHEAEQGIENGTWELTASEYVYDQLFINAKSPIYIGV